MGGRQQSAVRSCLLGQCGEDVTKRKQEADRDWAGGVSSSSSSSSRSRRPAAQAILQPQLILYRDFPLYFSIQVHISACHLTAFPITVTLDFRQPLVRHQHHHQQLHHRPVAPHSPWATRPISRQWFPSQSLTRRVPSRSRHLAMRKRRARRFPEGIPRPRTASSSHLPTTSRPSMKS